MRTFISLVGVAFAVLLVFMQLGFLDAVVRTASLLYDQLNFDLLLVSSEYNNMARPGAFPRRRLAQASADEAVQRTLPLTAMLGFWRDPRPRPDETATGRDKPHPRWSILVLGVEPSTLDQVFARPVGTIFPTAQQMETDRAKLSRLTTVLMDLKSRAEYGDPATWKPTFLHELNGRRVEVADTITVGTGFAYNGLVLTSEASLSVLLGWPEHLVSFGLIQLAPGTDPLQVRERLRERLGGPQSDVLIYTRSEINNREETFWLNGTAVGQFFFAGVIIALLVGAVFVYQMMATDIARRLPEYATIRAMGYPGSFLTRVVFWQGLLLALIGYIPGLLLALAGYELTAANASIPIGMTGTRLGSVLLMTVIMCMASAAVAVRAAHRANPADLF
ncbi:MAG: FtsX-like permease family protein [Gemmataceae bacterium]